MAMVIDFRGGVGGLVVVDNDGDYFVNALLFILASLMFACDPGIVCVLRAAARLIGGVPKFGHIGEFMRDARMPFIGFQSASVFFTGFLQLIGVVSLALLLLIFPSFFSYLRPIRVGDRFRSE